MLKKSVIIPLIRSVLKHTGTYTGEKDVQAVWEIGKVETNYRAIKQYPSGPAESFWQIEPYTAKSIYKSWVKGTRFEKFYHEYRTECLPLNLDMRQSLCFAIFLCRMQLWFDTPKPIPETKEERAVMWVNHYNKGGKGTVEKYLKANKR